MTHEACWGTTRREDQETTREWVDRRCTKEKSPVDRLRVTVPDGGHLLPRGDLPGMSDLLVGTEARDDSSETSRVRYVKRGKKTMPGER